MTSLPREARPAPEDRLLNIVCAESDLPWVEGYLVRVLGLQPGQYFTPQRFELDQPVITEMDRIIESSRYTLLVISPASRADRWASYLEQLASFASLDKVRLICLLLTLADALRCCCCCGSGLPLPPAGVAELARGARAAVQPERHALFQPDGLVCREGVEPGGALAPDSRATHLQALPS